MLSARAAKNAGVTTRFRECMWKWRWSRTAGTPAAPAGPWAPAPCSWCCRTSCVLLSVTAAISTKYHHSLNQDVFIFMYTLSSARSVWRYCCSTCASKTHPGPDRSHGKEHRAYLSNVWIKVHYRIRSWSIVNRKCTWVTLFTGCVFPRIELSSACLSHS